MANSILILIMFPDLIKEQVQARNKIVTFQVSMLP